MNISKKQPLGIKFSIELRPKNISYDEHVFLMIRKNSKCPKDSAKKFKSAQNSIKPNLKVVNQQNCSKYHEWFLHLAPPKVLKQKENKTNISNSATQSLTNTIINKTKEIKPVQLVECDERIQIGNFSSKSKFNRTEYFKAIFLRLL